MRRLPGRRAELVFAYLAAEHDRTVSRDELAEALWPQLLPESWAPALRGVVSEVRRYLEDAGLDPAEVLATAHGGYRLRLPEGFIVDLDEARSELASARTDLAAGAAQAAAVLAQRAFALARLPFLPEHEGEWVDGVRRELDSIRVRALELQAQAYTQAGDLPAAARATEELVRAEPFSEAAHRLRIRALGEAGDRAGAVRAYEECRAMLADRAGVQPSAETEAIYLRAVAAQHANSAASPAGFGDYSVLVVEDHDFQRRTVVQLLRRLGVGTLSEAPDGGAALELLAASEPPDVIVCDVDMPGMDGVEFIRHVSRRGLASAVVIASGLERDVLEAVEAVSRGYGVQVLGVVQKPLTARRLEELLASYVRPPPNRDGAGGRVEADDVVAALEGGRIVVHFQPIVDLATGQVGGAEALPRWHDPDRGWIAPQLFLPVLESASTSVQFTDYLLERVCRGLDEFARAGLAIAVSVRIPGPSLGDVLLPDRIGELVHERNVDPRRIACVVGEHSLRTDSPATLDLLVRLRVKGVGLQLDEFGTGNTRDEQLARLPLTGVRLASSVLSRAALDARKASALEEALALARRLGLPAVALGCDSREDFELLLQTGCSHAQGSFIAEALPGTEFVDLAASWSPPPPVAGEAR